MSRSHQNAYSQQHQQNWFMSPNLVNSLFCSSSNSSNPNCNNFNNGPNNVNNHLNNLLNAQSHYLSTNPLNNNNNPSHNNSPQSYLGNNPAFPHSYHNNHHQPPPQSSGGNQHIFSSMFSSHCNSNLNSNCGGNGNNVQLNPNSTNTRFITGQNNHHYQNNNQSRSYATRAGHSSRNPLNSDYNLHTRRYPTNVLNLPNNIGYPYISPKTNSDYSSNNYNNDLPINRHSSIMNRSANNNINTNIQYKTYPKYQFNNELDLIPVNQQPIKHSNQFYNNSPKSNHIQIKGMENIRLDNEGNNCAAYKFNNNVSMPRKPGLGIINTVIDSKDIDNYNKKHKYSYDSSNNSSDNSFNKYLQTDTIKSNNTVIKEEILYYKSEIEEETTFLSDNIINDDEDDDDIGMIRSTKTTSTFTQTIENPSQSLNPSIPSYTHKNNLFSSVINNNSDSSVLSSRWTNVPPQSSLSSINVESNYSGTLVNSTSNLMDQVTTTSTTLTSNAHQLQKSHVISTTSKQIPIQQSTQTNDQPFNNAQSDCFKHDSHSMNSYHDWCSNKFWEYYVDNRQTEVMYVRKVQLRNALHMVMSYVFENAGLFIVGSSMNGFGVDNSDMDLCLTISNKELDQKKEAFVVLHQLVEPLRKCSFIKNLQLIRANVPILKFRDSLAGVDCDLNINNVVGIYNTHLMAMYNRIDWRVRPLGMYIKHWAQKLDLHDASRGRLSTYTLILMVIHYLQAGCQPAILPSLQMKYPKYFSYERHIKDVDMRLELPWDDLRSTNHSRLSELFMGFFEYYSEKFDFSRMVVSVRQGKPLPIDVAIKQLPAHEQLHNVQSFKMFIEEPFSLTNVARSLFDELVFSRVKRSFRHTLQIMRMKQPLKLIFTLPSPTGSTNSLVSSSSSSSPILSSNTHQNDESIDELTVPDNITTSKNLSIDDSSTHANKNAQGNNDTNDDDDDELVILRNDSDDIDDVRIESSSALNIDSL